MNNFIKIVLNYLKGVADPSDNNSDAKLFIGLTAFGYILLSGLIDLFTPLTPTEFVFFGILGLVVSIFGLTTYLKGKSMDIKGDVASDVVKNEADKETTKGATDVLKSDKP